LLGKLLYTLEDPGPDDRLEPELGLVVDSATVALDQRRSVGLPPLPGLPVRHVDPAGPAATSGIRPGDLLRTADRRPLRNRHDLQVAASRGRAVALEIARGTKPLRLRLNARERPRDGRRPRSGRAAVS
jgi:S1-C subfamily serine protease